MPQQILARNGLPGALTYGGAKARLMGVAHAITADYAAQGIRTDVLSRGTILTDPGDDPASLLASAGAGVITGAALLAGGGNATAK